MTSTLKNSKAIRITVVAVLAVVMGVLFAAPSGAWIQPGCYPSCTTTTEQVATTTAVEETTTSTTAVTAVEETSTSTTAVAGASHEDEGGGSLPVTGGDIIGLLLAGLAALALGSGLVMTSRSREVIKSA